MSIEENIARLAEAQERTATALEAILAHLGGGVELGLGGLLAKHAAAGDIVPDDQAVSDAKAAEEAEAKKKAAAAAKKKAEAEAAAKKRAEEEEAAAAAAAADPLADAPAEEEKKLTLDDVRSALQAYRSIEGAPAMMEVLKTHGKADALSAVKPENFAAIMAAINIK